MGLKTGLIWKGIFAIGERIGRNREMREHIRDMVINTIDKVIDNKYFVVLLCFATLVFGTLYYYGLQMAFNPDAEDLSLIWNCYSMLELGQPLKLPKDFICDTLAVISTAIGGMSFLSFRLRFTSLQSVILVCTMWLSFRGSKKQDICLFLVPIFVLFMILLHPVTQEDPYGLITDYGTDFFYQYPYNYHPSVRIYTLLCLIIMGSLLYATSVKKKVFTITLLSVIILYTVYLRDTLFFILFLMPLCIVLFFKMLHEQKTRKYVIFFVCTVMVAILMIKVIPSPLRSELWTTAQASTYGKIYGATNWITPDQIWETISNYVSKILGIFNIAFPGTPLISLYTVIYMFKLILLVVGYIIVALIAKGSIVGSQKWKSVDIVDEILAWSCIALSAAHIFTEYGLNVIYSQRYIQAVVSIMTIILCRNIIPFLNVIHWDFKGVYMKEKMEISFILLVLCLCYLKPVWNYTPANHCHEADMNAAIDYIRGTNFGYAIAPYNFAGVMSAMSNGEVLIYNSIEEVQGVQGEDARIAYMITRYDYEPGKYHSYMYYEEFESYSELCDKYSEPTNIIDYDTFSLCVWENGIKIPD